MEKERKTRNMYLMVKPSIYDLVKKAAEASDTSVNEFMCRLLSYHFRNETKRADGVPCPSDSYRKLVSRMRFNAAVAAGKIIRKPCSVCGAVPAEGHHPDYSKPYEVEFLCRQHHREVHAKDRIVVSANDSLTGWLFPEMVTVPVSLLAA